MGSLSRNMDPVFGPSPYPKYFGLDAGGLAGPPFPSSLIWNPTGTLDGLFLEDSVGSLAPVALGDVPCLDLDGIDGKVAYGSVGWNGSRHCACGSNS